METYAKLRQQDNQDMGAAENPILRKRPLPEGGAPPGCMPAGHLPVSPMSTRSPGCCVPHSQEFCDGQGAPLVGTQGPMMESSGLVRAGWGRCPSRSRGCLSGPKAHAGWGRSRVRRRGRGQGRSVGEEGSKAEGAANERERERRKAGGRRSRATGQGRGDPGREVGRGKTGKRRETVWACGRKRTSLV